MKLWNATTISADQMQPFNLFVTSLRQKIVMLHVLYGLLVSTLVVFLVFIGLKNGTLETKLESPVAYMIPGHIPDVIKVRANSVPDSVVFDFFDFLAAQVGNISSENMEVQYAAVERYLAPEFKARFRAINKTTIPLWKERRIDQFITYKPPEKFERKATDSGTEFSMSTWINVQRYMDGKALKPYRERLEISFRTSAIDETKAWIFEVTNIKRETEEEFENRSQVK